MNAHGAAGQRYRPQVILPPGWLWVPLTGNRKETARKIFQEQWRDAPRDSVGPFIRQLETSLLSLIDEASDQGGLALIMPFGTPWQVPVSTSITLSAARAPDGTASLPEGADIVMTDAGPALYNVEDLPLPLDVDPAELRQLRAIEVTWAAPDGETYLMATAAISGLPVAEYEPIVEALTTLIVTMLDAALWIDEGDNGDTAR